MNNHYIPKLFSSCFLIVLLLSACTGAPAGGTTVWIDVPLDGLTFPSVQSIQIEGHAASPGGISRVELWVNGALATTVNDPPAEGTLANFHADWLPPASGEYTIQAVAFSSDGVASQPDTARVSFGVAGVTPVITVTSVITITPVITVTPTLTQTLTPTSPPEAVIQFWADPPEIEAGACTSIRWHVENVQRVIFGGVDQAFDGSYKECLCSDQRYTLTVVKQDGSEEKNRVDIRVNGDCITPVPVDSTPPPVPSPAVPTDGLTIACKAAQSLAWLPVDDSSGIAEYRVQVQRQAGDNNWQAAPSGDMSVTDKTISVPVECGWYYRWRVRAVDGLGNVSDWSSWSTFAITLN